ncbi:MAG TPA: redoxin family protein [Gemmataceae bacterium]|nr:redoxin family protein [Gemmataceae bacterium]
MRVVACICWTACCLSLAGCSVFGKKNQTPPNPPAAPLAATGWSTTPAGNSGAPAQTTARGGAILAGRVLDSYERRPPATFIQVVAAGDANGKGAPIEIAADEQGFFTIHGLQTGQHYELIARTREGGPKLAGRVWATPPNPRLLIYMSDDFATQNTPAAPGPTTPGQKPTPTNAVPGPGAQDSADGSGDGASGERTGAGNDPLLGPGAAARPNGRQRPVDILPPVRLSDTPPAPATGSPGTGQPRAEIRPQDIAGNPNLFAQGNLPANIPPQGGFGVQPAQVQPAPLAATVPMVATQVPSCILTGRQLENFALYDVNGQVWEYRGHRGKLVLLDFWGTWCPYCMAAIPHLKILQDTYGASGLEVIGIDYEKDGSYPDHVRAVQGVRDRRKINYRLLIGSDIRTCPVRTQFAVDLFPTVVLLDANNRIIWRETGLLDQVKLRDLQVLIESQLRQP